MNLYLLGILIWSFSFPGYLGESPSDIFDGNIEWIAMKDPGCNGPCASFYIQVYHNGHASYYKLDQMSPITYKTKIKKEEVQMLWEYVEGANLENRKKSFGMESQENLAKIITWKKDGIIGKLEFKEYETEEIKILVSKLQSIIEYSKWKAGKKEKELK